MLQNFVSHILALQLTALRFVTFCQPALDSVPGPVLSTGLNWSWWFYYKDLGFCSSGKSFPGHEPPLLLAQSLVSLFLAFLRACCPRSSQAQVSINSSWKTPRLDAEVPATANVSIAGSQNTDLYIFCLRSTRICLCTKTQEVEKYIIHFALMNYFLPTKCVFLSRSMTLNVMKMN